MKRRRVTRRRWRPEEDAQLRKLYPCTRSDLLPQQLRRSRSAIDNRVAALHLRKNDDVSLRRPWRRADDQQLRTLYPDHRTTDVARQLHRTLCSTYGRAQTLGLEKSAAYLASPAASRLRRGDNVGAAYRFPKGHVPANKGLRRPGYAVGRMRETQFKKGQSGWNWRPIGSKRLVDGYLYTKVSDRRRVSWTRNWKPTHVLLWEKQRGRIPRGHCLTFVNGDRTDVRLGNLKLISRGDNMRRNTIHNLPEPLKRTIVVLGALRRKINRRTREHEEQNRRSA